MTTPSRRELLTQAHTVLDQFDERHPPMLAAVMAAIEAFLDLVRTNVMGRKGGPLPEIDLDQFPVEAEWLAIAHRRLDRHIRSAFTAAYLEATGGDDIVNTEPFIAQHIATVSDRLRDWPAGVFEEMRHEIHEAHTLNESTDELRDRIGAVLTIDAPSKEIRGRIADLGHQINQAPDKATAKALRATRSALYDEMRETDYAWHWRADRIARTELAVAVNGGTYRAHVALAAAEGVTPRKQWLSTSDERTRPSHALANGQVRSLEQAFDIGGANLLYPGDPDGPAGETINCRCALVILAPDQAPLDLNPIGDFDTEGGPSLAAAMEADMAAPVTDTELPDTARALPNGWRGPLAPLDVPSGDGRIIGHPDGEPQVRQLPIPLLAQEALADRHDGAIVVGLAERAWIQDGQLWGEGPLDLSDERASQWARRLADGYAGWVSVDLDAVTMTEMMMNTATGEVTVMPPVDEAAAGLAELLDAPPKVPDGHEVVYRAHPWRLMSATLVSQPAFHEGARVSPVWDYDGPGTGTAENRYGVADVQAAFPPSKVPGKPPGDTPAKPPAGKDNPGEGEPKWIPEVGDRVIVDDPSAGGPGEVTEVDTTTDPIMVTVQLDAGGPVEVPVDKVSPEVITDAQKPPARSSASLVRSLAAAGTVAPPPDWFNDPHLAAPTPVRIDGDRITGHLALWSSCHVSFPGTCVTPPASDTGYTMFHTGEVLCADGTLIPVGKITLGTGHADPEAGFRAAADHYDHTGTAVAVVRAYEDSHGIAVAGALCDGVTDAQVAALRRSPLSGDWRRVGGNLELVAALAVNVPGFPVPRTVAASGDLGVQVSLVAAGAITPRPHSATVPAPKDLASAISAALAQQDYQRRRAEALAARMAAADGAVWGRTKAAILAAHIKGGDTAQAVRVAAGYGYTEENTDGV